MVRASGMQHVYRLPDFPKLSRLAISGISSLALGDIAIARFGSRKTSNPSLTMAKNRKNRDIAVASEGLLVFRRKIGISSLAMAENDTEIGIASDRIKV